MRIAAVQGVLLQYRGADLAFLNMVLALKRRGHEIDVYSLVISEDFKKTLTAFQIPFFSIGNQKKGPDHKNALLRAIALESRDLASLYDIMPFKKLGNLINSGGYDCAFVHHTSSVFVIPFLILPVTYYCQEPPRNYFYEPRVSVMNPYLWVTIKILRIPYAVMDWFATRNAGMVLVNSCYSAESLWKAYGVSPRTVYLGADPEALRKIPTGKEHAILSIGALQPKKAHEFVIRSAGLIPKAARPKVIIAGAGSERYKSLLIDTARQKDVRVEFIPFIRENEMADLYNRVKITAIAYIMEPFGLTAIESMACETPVVAVREGGLRESVTEETGILTDRDEKEFAGALEYLLSHPEICERMGKAGRLRVRQMFTWEKCGARLEGLLLRDSKPT